MTEETLSARTVFEGRLLRLEVLDVALTSGSRSVREVVRHPGAVVVLAEREGGDFVFVRQYRKPIERSLLEAVAGTLEPGEEPAACAARELREETGHEATRLRPLGVIYSAPGYSDEALHVYHARLTPGARKRCPDEDESIEVAYLPRERVRALIRAGELGDAKTLAAWSLYQEGPGGDANGGPSGRGP